MCVPSFLDAVDIASHHNQDLQAPCGELIVRKMNLLWQLGGILTFENGRHHHQHGKPWKQRWKATPQGAQAWQANHSHKLSTEESLAPHLKAWKNWSLQNHWYRHLRQEGRKISAKRYTLKYTCIYSYNMNIYIYIYIWMIMQLITDTYRYKNCERVTHFGGPWFFGRWHPLISTSQRVPLSGPAKFRSCTSEFQVRQLTDGSPLTKWHWRRRCSQIEPSQTDTYQQQCSMNC